MRFGVRFALDLGSVRIGVAKSDPHGILASPFSIWPAADWSKSLQLLLQEYEPLEIYIGLPKNLRGEEAEAALAIRQWALEIREAFPEVVFILVDERLTTAAARKQLQQAGYNSKSDRQLIDAAAATVLLQDVLDAEKASGAIRGETL